ncbi:MAG: hypothetical protein ACRERE_26945 [Candidatus Entotheonellia bacterium]
MPSLRGPLITHISSLIPTFPNSVRHLMCYAGIDPLPPSGEKGQKALPGPLQDYL